MGTQRGPMGTKIGPVVTHRDPKGPKEPKGALRGPYVKPKFALGKFFQNLWSQNDQTIKSVGLLNYFHHRSNFLALHRADLPKNTFFGLPSFFTPNRYLLPKLGIPYLD